MKMHFGGEVIDIPQFEKGSSYFLDLTRADAVSILKNAYDVAVNTEEEEETCRRLRRAIMAIGMETLLKVEQGYTTGKKRFRVRIGQTKIVEVEANDEKEANEKALANLVQHEEIVGSPEVVDTENIDD